MSGWKRSQEWFDWTPERIARLRELWDSGMQSSAIALDLGTTRNSVLGKAHRLKLPSRPMPRSPFVQPDAPPEVSYREAMDIDALRAHAETRRAYKLPIPVGAVGRAPTCQWTDSNRKPWVFCGCKSAAGYSYCDAHKAIVFRRADAVAA